MKESRLHSGRSQNQLNCLCPSRVGGAPSSPPPSFSQAATKREGAGSEKSWRPGCQPLLLGARSDYIGSSRRNRATTGQELPSMGVLESVFGEPWYQQRGGRCSGSLSVQKSKGGTAAGLDQLHFHPLHCHHLRQHCHHDPRHPDQDPCRQ